MNRHLLPEVQAHSPAPGSCHLAALRQGWIGGLPQASLDLVRAQFAALPWVLHDDRSAAAPRALFASQAPAPDQGVNSQPVAPPITHEQGYTLAIRPGEIEVLAATPAGLWYGLQTLALLCQESPAALPCQTICDWPALARRGIHIDLKGYQPTLAALQEMIGLLGQRKVNAILLELEDKFLYSGHGEFAAPGALTPRQLRELGRFCTANFIELIPKVQCLGHVDYLLKHPHYAHLRENGHPYQFCPQHPGTFPLWRDMALEVMDCLPGHRYFHIGADETSHLGECPRCSGQAKTELYSGHVNQCLDLIIEQGRQPLIWDDMVRHMLLQEGAQSPSLEQIAAKAVLVYWSYGYGGQNNTFAHLKDYAQRGAKVWGASGYSGCGGRWFQNVPPLRERAQNIAAWSKSAQEHGLEGVISTSWTRIASAHPPTEVPEACWLHMLYAAASMWRGQEQPLPAFCTAAWQTLFGVDLPAYSDFLMDLELKHLPRAIDPAVALRQAPRLALLIAAVEGFAHERMRQYEHLSIYELLHMYHGGLGQGMVDYALQMFEQKIEAFNQSLTGREAMLHQALSTYYTPHTVADVLQSRFARDHDLVGQVRQLLRQTATL